MTPLGKTLKRALVIQGVDYVVTLAPEFLRITKKGRRLGLDLQWHDLISGESALAIALRASVGKFDGKTTLDMAPKKAALIRPAIRPARARRSTDSAHFSGKPQRAASKSQGKASKPQRLARR